MNTKTAFLVVRYMRSINKGNKVWKIKTGSMGVTAVLCWNKDTDEIMEWSGFSKETYKSMRYCARYTDKED